MAILAAYPHLACPVDEGGNVLERGARKVRIPTDPGIYTEVLCPVEETFDLLGKVRKEEGEQ